MDAWLISIVGIICLGILLEIVMPEGQTTKYVRGAFSLLVIFVVAAPLPKLLGEDFTISLEKSDISTDGEFLSETAMRYESAAALDVENYLLLNGYVAEVKIVTDEENVSKILRFDVIIKLSVLEAENANTHIAKVRELICVATGVEESAIFITVEITPDGGETEV